MKTLKLLKITSILQIIFCLLCIASTVCFAIASFCESQLFFEIADALIRFWIINPVAPISFLICLPCFLIERRNPESRAIIGRRWVWIFLWPVITALMYLTAGMLTVAFTGGV